MRNLSTARHADCGEAEQESGYRSRARRSLVARSGWEAVGDGPSASAIDWQIAVLDELAQVRMARDYDWAELQAVVKQLARAGRDAGMMPEQMLAIVRQLGDQAAMGEVSEWWRSILMDRIERWCAAAYYCLDDA